jgi:hypothetical protein
MSVDELLTEMLRFRSAAWAIYNRRVDAEELTERIRQRERAAWAAYRVVADAHRTAYFAALGREVPSP